jgi:hypothetical protein
VDLVVLAVIWIGTKALSEGVARIPVGWEVGVTIREISSVDILRKTRFLVCADGISLDTGILVSVEVLGISAAEHIETVAVISSHNDQSVLSLANFLKLSHSCLDGVIELEQLTQGTIVVQDVHLLVDGGGLGHEKPTSVAIGSSASVENIDGLESHLLETRLVSGVIARAIRSILAAAQVLGVDIAVKPSRVH